MKWQIIESGPLPSQEIMDKDAKLLEEMQPDGPPLLHFYQWSCPSITYGYFTRPFDHLNQDEIEAFNLQIARRPTGGGIIFHLTDFAFSILVPANHPGYSINPLQNYAYINLRIASVIQDYCAGRVLPSLLEKPFTKGENFCMAYPTKYDLIIDGKKAVGAAQRKTKQGYLHQGSISLACPDMQMLQAVLKNPSLSIKMQENTFCLVGEGQDVEQAKDELKSLIIHYFFE